MNSIYDINFAELYQQHLRTCRYHDVSAAKWDKKAVKFAETFVEKENPYTTHFLQRIQLNSNETVLDIGCGPGTLAIPLARRCQQVYALDFSQGMLSLLRQYQQQLGLYNILSIQRAWQDDWSDVPQADVVIASRATLVSDLDEAIDKLTAKAKKRVYLTAITRPHFLDREIFHAIERDDLGFPTYIYLLNRLYQRGIEAELYFLPSPTSAFQGEYQDFENAVEFSLGKLNNAEKTKLFGFYQRKQQQNQPIQQGQDKWALISWQCGR